MICNNFLLAAPDSRKRKVSIVITDGKSTNFMNTWRAARTVRDSGVNMVSVGIGNNLGDNELRSMASEPTSENVFRVNSFVNLANIVESMRDTVCNGQ